MINGKSVFFIVMCLLSCIQMPIYCYFKVKGKGKSYTLSKCAGSLIFVITAAVSLVISSSDIYAVLVLIGMILSLIGDYLLSLTASHRLKIGGCTFMAAHICFTSAFIYAAGFRWQVIPVIVVLLAGELIGAKLFKLKTRGASKEMVVYITAVTTMAVCAGSLLFADSYDVQISNAAKWMTVAGAFLFLVSDCLWMTYGMIFGNAKPALKIANVLTYFPAQMLIAGALLFR